jgi:hypothetical protein
LNVHWLPPFRCSLVAWFEELSDWQTSVWSDSLRGRVRARIHNLRKQLSRSLNRLGLVHLGDLAYDCDRLDVRLDQRLHDGSITTSFLIQ